MLTYFIFCSSQEVSYSSSLHIYNASAGSCCVTKKEKLDEMKTTFLQNVNEELKEPVNRIISPLDSMLKYMNEGKDKLQLEEDPKPCHRTEKN